MLGAIFVLYLVYLDRIRGDPCVRARYLGSIGLEVEGPKLKVDMKKLGVHSLSPPFQEKLSPYTKHNLVCTYVHNLDL